MKKKRKGVRVLNKKKGIEVTKAGDLSMGFSSSWVWQTLWIVAAVLSENNESAMTLLTHRN